MLLIYPSGFLGGDWSNIDNVFAGAASATDGHANTLSIINQPGHINSAAQLCADLDVNGYDDWYLPARDQITIAFPDASVINAALIAWGGFILTNGWTSTEQNEGTTASRFGELRYRRRSNNC